MGTDAEVMEAGGSEVDTDTEIVDLNSSDEIIFRLGDDSLLTGSEGRAPKSETEVTKASKGLKEREHKKTPDTEIVDLNSSDESPSREFCR